MIRPTLEYASAAWDPYEQKQITQLEAVQNRAARFAKNEHRRQVSVTGLKESLNWRSLQERRFITRQTLFYKAHHGLAAVDIPPYIGRPPPPNPEERERRTSHDIQYRTGHTRVDSYKYSFFPRTIQSWNILDESVVTTLNQKKQPCADLFKKRLTNCFTQGSMYMVDPRGVQDRPRLGSTRRAGPVGPVF